MDKAAELLRKKGLVTAAKKAGRQASEGLVHAYIHGNSKIGVLVEVNCETDFVAKTDQFRDFVRDVAMQIAAMNPRYLSPEDVPADVVAKEREILTEQGKATGKPEAVLGKIVDGQIKKWYGEVCLLEQAFVKENKKTISQCLTEVIAQVGENCKIRRFVRWEVGQ
jgi:elongation factor Ts